MLTPCLAGSDTVSVSQMVFAQKKKIHLSDSALLMNVFFGSFGCSASLHAEWKISEMISEPHDRLRVTVRQPPTRKLLRALVVINPSAICNYGQIRSV